MTLAKQLVDKARENGAIAERSKYFSVTDKKKVEVNGELIDVEVPNGQHRVKIISQKIGKGKNFKGVEQEMLIMVVDDNGAEKLWDMPIKNEEGKLYYLIEDLENIEIGEEFFVEAFKLQNGKYGKRITKVASGSKGESIPTIQLDEQASEGDRPGLGEGEDISIDDLPF
jgi:methyl coenzyme M reductase subunit D